MSGPLASVSICGPQSRASRSNGDTFDGSHKAKLGAQSLPLAEARPAFMHCDRRKSGQAEAGGGGALALTGAGLQASGYIIKTGAVFNRSDLHFSRTRH